MIVVRLPESKIATYTLSPAGLTASSRGSSPWIVMRCGGAARLAGSKTSTVLVIEHET
jgi:hypothetical protein